MDSVLKRGFLVSALALAGMVGSASAAILTTTVTSTGTGNNGETLAASATFTIDTSTNTLTIVLTNTSTADVNDPPDILTALFFDLLGQGALTPVSALLTSGSVVWFDTAPTGGNVGGEWAYGSGFVDGSTPSGSEGISSSGFGLFGGANFNGPNLDPPPAIDGLNYGITSAGDNSGTGNAAVTGGVPLIKNSVTFTLTGDFTDWTQTTLNSNLTNVAFQYGTSLTGEPCIGDCGPVTVPEPGLPLLFGAALLAWGATRRLGSRG